MSQEPNTQQVSYPEGLELYHYTDAKGLIGILESKKIWATHIRYLNDTREFRYAIDLAHTILDDGDFPGAEDSDIGALKRATDDPQKFDSFVVSFSELGDDLNQWRAYSHNGAGFNIRFDPSRLDCLESEYSLDLLPCCYCKQEQMNRLREVYATATSQVVSGKGNAQFHYLQLVGTLLRTAATIKYPAFTAEKEWRLIFNVLGGPGSNIKCRPGKSMIIPYVELDLTTREAGVRGSPIIGVRVGPSALEKLSVHAIKRYLEGNCLPNIDPDHSKVPYRNW